MTGQAHTAMICRSITRLGGVHGTMLGVSLLVILGLFHQGLLHQQIPAFRDGLHFYYPMFQWLDDQARQGHIFPGWNNQVGFGGSAIGDGSSAMFYPGRLLFFIPGLTLIQKYTLYLAAHQWLAIIATAWVAYRWRMRPTGVWIAAFSFGLSGYVLFQTYNVIYLVGASWLPLAIYFGRKLSRISVLSWRPIIGLGLTLTMMVLGGDPQLAFHVVLVLIAWITFRTIYAWWHRRRISASREAIKKNAIPLAAIFLAAAWAICLSMIQILPTWHWAALSDRGRYNNVESVASSYEEAPVVGQNSQAAKLSPSQKSQLSFSTPPWRWVTLLFPNVLGHVTPYQTRWIAAWEDDSRYWTPSLYLGTLPILLAALGFARRCNRSPRIRVLRILVIISLLMAMGNYGLGYGIVLANRLMQTDMGNCDSLGTGSVYWLVQQIIPGYQQFRYPAKWLIFTTWGISLTAGIVATSPRMICHHSFRRALAIVIVLASSVAAMGMLAAYLPESSLWISSWHNKVRNGLADSWYGSVESYRAAWLIGWSGSQVLLFAIVLYAFSIANANIGLLSKRSRYLRNGIVPLLILDLWMAASPWWVWGTPTSETHREAVANFIPQRAYMEREIGSWRLQDSTSANQRISVDLRRQQSSLAGRFSAPGIANIRGQWSLTPAPQRALITLLQQKSSNLSSPPLPLHKSILDWQQIQPYSLASDQPNGSLLYDVFHQENISDSQRNPSNVILVPERTSIRQVKLWPEIDQPNVIANKQTTTINLWGKRFERVAISTTTSGSPLLPDAFVEINSDIWTQASSMNGYPSSPAELSGRIETIEQLTDRWHLKCRLDSPVCWCIHQFQDGGWTARMVNPSIPLAVSSANGLHTALLLPKGEYEFIVEYHTPGLRLGVLLSGLSGLLTVGAWVIIFWKKPIR